MDTTRIKELAKAPPLNANPNPSLYGERYSFKQEDTPYHNGRECLFSAFGEVSDPFSIFTINPLYRASYKRVYTNFQK